MSERLVYTSGPWAVENCTDEELVDIVLDYEVPGGGCPILLASCFHDEEGGRPGDIPLKEALANARLIAAAPQLLEALVRVVAIAGKEPEPNSEEDYEANCHEFTDAMIQANAAIDKATGKS